MTGLSECISGGWQGQSGSPAFYLRPIIARVYRGSAPNTVVVRFAEAPAEPENITHPAAFEARVNGVWQPCESLSWPPTSEVPTSVTVCLPDPDADALRCHTAATVQEFPILPREADV